MSLSVNRRQNLKAIPETNTLAYLTGEKAMNKKGFTTPTPVVNVIKPFLFITDASGKEPRLLVPFHPSLIFVSGPLLTCYTLALHDSLREGLKDKHPNIRENQR